MACADATAGADDAGELVDLVGGSDGSAGDEPASNGTYIRGTLRHMNCFRVDDDGVAAFVHGTCAWCARLATNDTLRKRVIRLSERKACTVMTHRI
jgi:hypothetical protein